MRSVTASACLLVVLLLAACEQPKVAQLLEGYWYKKAVIVILSPSTENPYWQTQQQALKQANLAQGAAAIIEVVSYQLVRIEGKQKVQMSTPAFYKHFDLPSDAFAIVIIDKNGDKRLAQATPLSVSELQSFVQPQ